MVKQIATVTVINTCSHYMLKSFKRKLDDSKRRYIENNVDKITLAGNIKSPKGKMQSIGWVLQ